MRGELIKVRASRSTWLLISGAVTASVILAGLQLGLDTDASAGTIRWGHVAERFTDPADLARLLDVATVIGLLAVLLGAAALPGEFRYQTIAPTFLANPSSLGILWAKAVVAAGLGACMAIAAQAATLGVATGWLFAAGVQVPVDAGIVRILLFTRPAAALVAVLGVGIGAAVRHPLAAVLTVVAWVMVVEQILAGLVPGVRAALPFTGALGAMGQGGTADLAGWTAAIVLTGYAAAALVAGGISLTRRDLA